MSNGISDYRRNIIDAANVAIPRSRPNGWRRKYKPLAYWIGQTTVKCDLRPKQGQKHLG